MKEWKIILVRKVTELNGFVEKKIAIHQDVKDCLVLADSIFDGKSVCQIKKKVLHTNGELIIFVETTNSLPTDDSFIEDYFHIKYRMGSY